jgi:hypothetical protein
MLDWPEKIARDEHFSFFPVLTIKKFYNFETKVQCYETFYVLNLWARVFVPNRPLHPSLILVSKAGACPSMLHTWLSSRPFLKVLDLAEKACQGQTLALDTNICKLRM